MKDILTILLTFLSFMTAYSAYGAEDRYDIQSPPHNDSTKTEQFHLHYICDSADIDTNYLDNRKQIAKIRYYLQNSPRIDSITIFSWASPEGSYRRNRWLAQERGQSARHFLLANSPDSTRLCNDKIKISPLAENWTGLTAIVTERYNRPDRDKVLKILHAEGISDETRKWRLKQLDKGRTWRYLIDEYMAELRAATWVCVWAEAIDPLPDIADIQSHAVTSQKGIATRPAFRPDDTRRHTILGLKTNLLYDAVSALNFAIEVPLNEHFSFQYEHHYPWWLSRNNKYCLQFLSFGGEVRWWFAPKTLPGSADMKQRDALVGHFLGVYGWTGKSDIQAGRKFGCYQFEFCSAGLTYGYSMPIGKYLNMEFSISAGYACIPYRHYIPTPDWSLLIRDKDNAGTLHYWGPTKAEISLVIPFRIKTGGKR